MKYVILSTPLLLCGCGFAEWAVENEQAIQQTAKAVSSFNPLWGGVITLATTTVIAVSKWYTHKANTREVVHSVQKAKDEIPEEQQKLFKDKLNIHMPSKIKKVVAYIKKRF